MPFLSMPFLQAGGSGAGHCLAGVFFLFKQTTLFTARGSGAEHSPAGGCVCSPKAILFENKGPIGSGRDRQGCPPVNKVCAPEAGKQLKANLKHCCLLLVALQLEVLVWGKEGCSLLPGGGG